MPHTHPHPVLGAGTGRHADLILASRYGRQDVALDRSGQNEMRLRQGELFSDALPLSGTEGHQRLLVPPLRALRRETIRVETQRIRPDLRVMVDQIRAISTCRPAGIRNPSISSSPTAVRVR